MSTICLFNLYVSVWYISTNKTKLQRYPKEDEARDIYRRTVNKYTKEKEAVFIQLRDEDHNLLECELMNYTPLESPKRKQSRRK